jgi:hypothetical protein
LTPFASITGLGANLLIQLQLGIYVRASIFGNIMTQIFSIALAGLVNALYLTELGVHFQSRIITIASIISFFLSIFAPLLRAPIIIIQALMVTWISLKNFRNDPNYCGGKLSGIAMMILEGILYLFAAFIPFPIITSWVNWADLARGVNSFNVIRRVRAVDFNKPGILDISFLWNGTTTMSAVSTAATDVATITKTSAVFGEGHCQPNILMLTTDVATKSE